MRARAGDPTALLSEDRARALALTPVAPEVAARLDRFVTLLCEWQERVNLIAASTVPEIWTRHIADSLQLLALAPQAKRWADLGSGGGFPGIPIACALAGLPGAHVDLVESVGKKAAFLQEAVRVLELPALVRHQRIADFVAVCGAKPPDVVTARALAPVNRLLTEAAPLIAKGATGLFLKGQDIEAELKEASIYWEMRYRLVPSRTSPGGRIVVIDHAKRR